MVNKKLKVHLIGICGKGMSGLAILLKQKGCRITGSDSGFYDPVYSFLKKNHIKFNEGYSAKNIPENANLIVIGKHAALTPEENEEVKYAFNLGIKIQSLSETLGQLVEKTENTVVAGSFGKSTTTALLAWCLEKNKKDPSYFIGAVPLAMKSNVHIGKSNHFILEGDEYPASNWDSTSKFLHLHPKNLILISALHDHLNVFPKESDYIKPYQKLVSLLPKNGLLVASSEGENVMRVIKNAKCKVVTYGLTSKSLWHPKNIKYGAHTTFDLYKGKTKIVILTTSLLGNHDIENIVGASAFLLEKKLLSPAELQKGIKTFKGLSGRLDLKTKKSSIPVYEAFGSSYIKAKSAFDALHLHFPKKRIIAVFEPHTFSWRNRAALPWYKTIFDGVSEVILLPPPTHGQDTHDQLSFEEIFNEVKKHISAHKANNEKEALTILKKIIKKNDLTVLVSSGSLLGLSKSVPKMVEKISKP